nr:MAG TPA: hypothetical protein [Caudoviricetes sp.]
MNERNLSPLFKKIREKKLTSAKSIFFRIFF